MASEREMAQYTRTYYYHLFALYFVMKSLELDYKNNDCIYDHNSNGN